MAKKLFARLTTIWLTLFWSTVTFLGLIRRWFSIGSRLCEEKLHRLPPKLQSDFSHGHLILPSGIRIHYVEEGPKDAPLMLLIHGFPEFWYSWRYQIKHFSDKFRVVAIDQRGYGESDKPRGIANYALRFLATDVKECIETLGYEKAVVVGHDWGASVAWVTALMYPGVVEKLIIMNCPHPGAFKELFAKSTTQIGKSWYMFFFQCPWLPECHLAADDFKSLDTAFLGKGGIKNKENFTEEDLEAWKYTFSQYGALTPPINYYRQAFRSGNDYTLKDIVQPETLIIWGDADAFIEKEGGTLSVSGCGSGQIVFIPGASHWVQQDEPHLVNYEMRTFLKT